MAVVELYSKRRKAELRAGEPDVYQYDLVPVSFRNQVVHILRDVFGEETDYGDSTAYEFWTAVHDIIAREKGLMQLGRNFGRVSERCQEWFRAAKADDALDMIELTFLYVDRSVREHDSDGATSAIEELNQRFREHDLGYQYENSAIIRLDSQYIHSEVIKPALALLADKPFETANTEFMTAHKHYRDGNHKDCVVAAQRAFESTLKAICSVKGWKFAKGDRAGELITAVRAHGLFPDYLDKSFDTYVAMLKTGLPGVRNNAGGHGDAPNVGPVPGCIAAYALHLTAANIVLAVEAFRALK